MSSYIAIDTGMVESLATLSLTAGAAATDFPLVNAQGREAYEIFKATNGTATIRAVFAGSRTLVAAAFINSNATAITVTNAAGFSHGVTIPTVPSDTVPLDAWIDLRGLALTSSATWNFALTGPASGVTMGRLVLVVELLQFDFVMGSVDVGENHEVYRNVTDGNVSHRRVRASRQRTVSGRVLKREFEANVFSLSRASQGSLYPCLVILDDDDSDAILGELTVIPSIEYGETGMMQSQLSFVELQKGIS